VTSEQTSNAELNDSNARLMLAVQANDAFAFEELTSRNQSRICAYLQRLVGNLQLAEDLTQEVFTRVYKHRATYRQEARFSTWLYRIAHNVGANALRAKSRRPEALFSVVTAGASSTSIGIEDGILARSGATPTRQLARVEIQEIVLAAVNSLCESQREAVILKRFEDKSYQEIADIMDLTPKAVKSLLHRAHCNLKEALEPYVQSGRRPK